MVAGVTILGFKFIFSTTTLDGISQNCFQALAYIFSPMVIIAAHLSQQLYPWANGVGGFPSLNNPQVKGRPILYPGFRQIMNKFCRQADGIYSLLRCSSGVTPPTVDNYI